MLERYGPWALVAGSAAGIGASYATELARAGFGLVLADVDAAGLDAQAVALRGAHGVEVRTVPTDLGDRRAVEALAGAGDAVDLGLLVVNAARSHVGAFADQSLEDKLGQLEVNLAAPLVLLDRLLPGLRARDRSGVILMSSQSSMRGAPLVASYAATKAYLRILAESLWDELRADGVDVMAVLPGSTATPGWLGSNPVQGTLGSTDVQTPDEVAAEALAALGTTPRFIPGQANRDSEAFVAGLDVAEAVTLVGQVMREMYPGR